jgi:hypothetical protein
VSATLCNLRLLRQDTGCVPSDNHLFHVRPPLDGRDFMQVREHNNTFAAVAHCAALQWCRRTTRYSVRVLAPFTHVVSFSPIRPPIVHGCRQPINPTPHKSHTRPGRVSEPVDPDCWMELAQVPARNAMRCGRYVPCCVHCVCMVPSNLWLLKRPFPQTRVLRRPRIMASGGPAVLL